MSKERYRRGAHTVTDFKYHFVWKTKYGYNVLKKDLIDGGTDGGTLVLLLLYLDKKSGKSRLHPLTQISTL